jgi:uncharacterized protein YceK
MKLMLICLAAQLLAGCSGWSATSAESAHGAIAAMSYVRDQRTGLCFGVLYLSGSVVRGITNVPCDKVESFLTK